MPTATTADDTAIEYERHGDGQPLVLLHGGMAPRQYWQPVVPQFDEYAPVIPQRPGFGTCLDDPAETGADEVLDREVEYVRELAAAVDGDPVVFGHSFGALTAIEAARTDRAGDGHEGIEAVVAYEPAVLVGEFREQADLADRMAALVDDGERAEAVKLYVEQVLHPDGVDDLDAWLDEWPVWPACVDLAEEVVRMNHAVEGYDLPDHVPVDAPVLVLTGTDGPQFLRDSARAVHGALPNSRFVDFDGVSHSGPAEAPARVAREVRSFLG